MTLHAQFIMLDCNTPLAYDWIYITYNSESVCNLRMHLHILCYYRQGDKEAGGVFYNENFLSDVIIRRSNFTLNYGQYGGAVSVYDSNVIVEDSNFTSNWVRGTAAVRMPDRHGSAGSSY